MIFKYLFFIGGGGTGKTFLIKVLSQWAEYILQKPGDVSSYPKVIRLAATGNAAYLIGKKLHKIYFHFDIILNIKLILTCFRGNYFSYWTKV